jgi:hypothetical protein
MLSKDLTGVTDLDRLGRVRTTITIRVTSGDDA